MRCLHCSTELTDDTDGVPEVCPSCGGDLGASTIERLHAPVDQLPDHGTATVVGLPRGTFALSLAAGLGAVSVLTAGLVALANDPLENAKLADRLPAGATAFVEVNVRGLLDGVDPLLEALSPLFPNEDVSVDAALEDLETSGEISLDQVLTWASGRAAVSYEFDTDGLMTGRTDPDAFAFFAVVDGRDGSALADFLATMTAGAAATTDVDGVTFWNVAESPTGFGPVPSLWVGQVEDDLLVSSAKDDIRSLLDVTPETSVSSQEGFRVAVDALPRGADALFALDTDPILAAYGELFGRDITLPSFGPTAFAGGGWSVASAELSPGRISVASVVAGPQPDYAADDDVVAGSPVDAIAWLRPGGLQRTIDEGISFFLESMSVSGLPTDPTMEQEARRIAGAARTVLALDSAVSVSPAEDPDTVLPVDVTVLGLGEGEVAAAIDELAATAPFAEKLESGRWRAEGFEIGVRDDLTVLTTRPALIDTPPSPGFDSSDLHATADSLVDGELVLAVDIATIVRLVLDLDDNTPDVAGCQPFEIGAVGTTSVDDTQQRADYVVTYQRRDCDGVTTAGAGSP